VHLIDRKDTLLLLFSFEQRNSSVNDAGDTRPRQMPRRPPRFSHPAAAVVVEIYLREKAAGTMSRNPAMTHRRLPARTGEREMEREWSYRVPTRASTCLMSSRNGCALSLVFSLLWLSCLRELLLSRDQVGQQRLSGAALLLASPLLSSPLSSPLLSSEESANMGGGGAGRRGIESSNLCTLHRIARGDHRLILLLASLPADGMPSFAVYRG